MDLENFKKRREELEQIKPIYRELCMRCLQPGFGCYCAQVQSFDPKIKFMILIHPIEVKRRIATGRMSHLCMENSELLMGQDYSKNQRIEEVLQDPQYQPMVLYPGRQSVNLTTLPIEQKNSILDSEKTPVIFVIDGTWATARKMVRLSQNIAKLPRICFTPPGPSQFRVRRQPGKDCYSTIEAIHHTVELLGTQAGFDVQAREHDKLLNVFDYMVERQLHFIREAQENPKSTSYRRPRHYVV